MPGVIFLLVSIYLSIKIFFLFF